MTFFETPRFPTSISRGAEGGPMYNTDIIELGSGHEQRNVLWPIGRHRYRVGLSMRPSAEIAAMRAFFRIVKGQGHGFRFKDWLDFSATVADGRLGTAAAGTGVLTYQLYKRYTSGASTDDRPITKTVSGGITCYKNAAPLTVGGAPGNISIDYTTGIVTFVATSTATINAITQANPGKVTTVAAHGFTNGQQVYLSGIGGMVELNGQVVRVTVVNADEFTIGISTSSYTAYTSGGLASLGPQNGDTLTWAGTFDVPVRFLIDWFRARNERAHGEWDEIEVIELS